MAIRLSSFAAALIMAGAAIVTVTPVVAQVTQGGALQPSANLEAVIGVGKSQVIQLPGPYGNLMVADSKIADVLPLTARSFYVVGKTLGTTGLTVYDPGKHLLASINVIVSSDL